MRLDSCFTRFGLAAFALAGSLAIPAVCVAQTKTNTVPDAQIEANVLKALAGAPELASQSISTTTVYGTVTLSGTVGTEAMRDKAEQLAANAPGVQKVVDELTLGAQNQGQDQQVQRGQDALAGAGAPQGVLQSDGTYAPAGGGQQATDGQDVPPPNGPNTDPYGHPLNGQQPEGMNGQQAQGGAPPASNQQGGYPSTPQGYGQPGYGQAPYGASQGGRPGYGYPNQGGYPSQGGAPQYGYNQQAPQGYGAGSGQLGGQVVTVPSGTLLQVRVNQHLNSKTIQAGTPFDAMVVNDIVSNGQVAIPRGASVQGTVIDAESSGALKGRGELGLRLDRVTLGGQTYPISSDVFTARGGDKTVQTVNSAVGLGALGAIFGAVAGGGAGAAIGAGVGGAVGLGASAASGRGNVFIPSEAVLTFRLTQPATVTTVSQVEMQRLGYGVPAGGPQMVRRYPPPPPYYYRPGYYPRYYYGPYGYYRY